MAGSQAFHLLSQHLSPAAVLQLVFAGSALALAAPLLTESYERTLLAFCVFEWLLGMYWPAIALLRCGALDDAQRASTMAVFRVLLNVLVITILPLAGGLPEGVAFSLGATLLLICLACIRVVKAEEEEAGRQGRRRGVEGEHGGDGKGNGRERLVEPTSDAGERNGLRHHAGELEAVSNGDSGGESDQSTGALNAPLRDRGNGHSVRDTVRGSPPRPSAAPEVSLHSSPIQPPLEESGMEMIARWMGSTPRHGKYSPVLAPHDSGSDARDVSPYEGRNGHSRRAS